MSSTKRNRWSNADDQFLIAGIDKGMSYSQIASQMNRTVRSCQQRKLVLLRSGNQDLPAHKKPVHSKRRKRKSESTETATQAGVNITRRVKPETLNVGRPDDWGQKKPAADVTQLMIAVAAGAASAIAAMVALGLFL